MGVRQAFPDIKPMPSSAPQAGPGLSRIGDNRPPLDVEKVADFRDGLNADPHLMPKINELLSRSEHIVDKCADADQAGRYADGCKQIAACKKAIDAERDKHNRPLLDAQRALKGAADGITDILTQVDNKLRRAINAFQREQQEIEAQQRREAEEAAAAARRAAEEQAATTPDAPAPIIDIAPAPVEETQIRGTFGAKAGTAEKWQGEVENVRQLPDRLLKHPKVVEALNKLINAEVRGGTREIKGARIWSETTTVIR